MIFKAQRSASARVLTLSGSDVFSHVLRGFFFTSFLPFSYSMRAPNNKFYAKIRLVNTGPENYIYYF